MSHDQSESAMATVSSPCESSTIIKETLEEIASIYNSLPPRPTIAKVETALSILKTLDTQEKTKLAQIISNPKSPDGLPPELFSLLQALRKTIVLFDGYNQKKDAIEMVQIDEMLQSLDDLILRAASVVSGDTQIEKLKIQGDPVGENDQMGGVYDGILKKSVEDQNVKSDSLEGSVIDSSTIATQSSVGITEEMNFMEVASLFESYAKTGATVLDLQGKLMDQVEWLPLSLGKLLNLTEINVSENRIMALPANLGELKLLKKFNSHSNQLINLPSSTGELVNLNDLDVHANRLKSLPASFGNLGGLSNLDLSTNLFVHLPDCIGGLSALEKLNLDMNELEELPCTIGSCISLVELRLDFNRLKALPEAIGNLVNLKILTLRYNRVKNLPPTMGNLKSLEEVNLSFNELESIPECLCFIRSLRKLNVGNNFADLTSLPSSIGDLAMLEELDISYDQIRVLPDSFRFLSRLRVFHADETPLEIPSREIPKLGAQAVVQHMAELVYSRNTFANKVLKKRCGFWSCILSMFCLDDILTTERN